MYYNSIYNGQQFETFELFTYRTASLHFAYHKKLTSIFLIIQIHTI